MTMWRELQEWGKSDPDGQRMLRGLPFDPDAPPPEWWLDEIVKESIFFGRRAAPEAVRTWHEHWMSLASKAAEPASPSELAAQQSASS